MFKIFLNLYIVIGLFFVIHFNCPIIVNDENHQIRSLPAVNVLFKESWEVFKNSALKLFLLSLMSFGISFLLVIIAGVPFLYSVISFFGRNGGDLGYSNLSNLSTAPVLFFASLIIIILLFMVAVNLAMQITTIFIVDKRGKLSVWQTFKESFSYVGPLLAASFLQFVLGAGALFFFVLPALLFYFLLNFTNYEVVIGGKRGVAALRSSVNIVSANFAGVFGRLLLLLLVYLGVNILMPLLTADLPSAIKILSSIILFLFNALFGWYALCYNLTLYKQAKASLGEVEDKKITWMWIVAGLGWIILIIFASMAFRFIPFMWEMYNLNKNTPADNSYSLPESENSPELDYFRTDENVNYDLPTN